MLILVALLSLFFLFLSIDNLCKFMLIIFFLIISHSFISLILCKFMQVTFCYSVSMNLLIIRVTSIVTFHLTSHIFNKHPPALSSASTGRYPQKLNIF